MAYLQQITQEQEALRYLPAANEYYYDQYSRNDESRFILEKNSWKSIKQNNSSGKYLTDKELEYVALMNGFLKNARFGVEYFALDFLCSELGVTERHLRRIRTNTSHVFITKWRKATRSYKGKLENVYAIRPTEHTVFLLGETNYYKSEYNSFANNYVQNVKLGHQCPTSIYKDENNINIRSRANFSNSNLNSKNTSTELVENSSGVAKGVSLNSSANKQTLEQAETLHEPQVVETTSPTPATVTPIRTKARPANKRKTKTREEQKQRKTCHVVNNGFLGKGKHLSEVQPYLTDEICEKLRSGSGRAFTNKAIKEITKAIAASDKGAQAFFYHINGLVAYLIPALIREKRCPEKTNSENYYTLAGMSEEDKLWHQHEKYLAEVEEEAIRHVNPKNHFRAKLANALEHAKAYEFLMAFVNAEMQDNCLKITLNKAVELSERALDIVLFQARAVFNNRNANGDGQYVEAVEYVVNAANSNFREPEKEQESELPKGKWGNICAEFVAEFGMNMYKHWLKPLSVVEKEGIIELSTSSDMVRDRIEQNYLPFLGKVAVTFGINKLGVNE